MRKVSKSSKDKKCEHDGCKNLARKEFKNKKLILTRFCLDHTFKKCSVNGCQNCRERTERGFRKLCNTHNSRKVRKTINGFLCCLYTKIIQRTQGRGGVKHPHLYIGKPVLPREVFYTWSKNHPDFLKLFKQWASAGYDRKLTPSVNRMNSKEGYLLNNIEWMTTSQNNSLASTVRKIKQRKEVYNLLGVNTNEKK